MTKLVHFDFAIKSLLRNKANFDILEGFLFSEYYLIKVNQFNERIRDKFDEWVYFLKTETIKPDFSAQGIKSAAKKLDVLSLTGNDRRAYERYEEDTLYEASMHESHYGRGKLDGRKEGRREGIEQGRQEEREKAEQEKRQVVKKLLIKGIDINTISDSTGLSFEVISNIKNELDV